jgi:hypothetical protein
VYLQRKWLKQQKSLHPDDIPVQECDTNPHTATMLGFWPVGCNDDAAMLPLWAAAALGYAVDQVAASGSGQIVDVEFEHHPLNRTVGEKSRFLGFDADNAGDEGKHNDVLEPPKLVPSLPHRNLLPTKPRRNWQPALVLRRCFLCDPSRVLYYADGAFAQQGLLAHADLSGGASDIVPPGDKVRIGLSTALLYSMVVAEAHWESNIAPAAISCYRGDNNSPQSLDDLFATWPVLRHKNGAEAIHRIAMRKPSVVDRSIVSLQSKPLGTKSLASQGTIIVGAEVSGGSSEPGAPAHTIAKAELVRFAQHFGQKVPAPLQQVPLTMLGASLPWDSGFHSWASKVQQAKQMGVSVEHLCIDEYNAAGGWMGMHVEGGPLLMLAALFSFEVVFGLQWSSTDERYQHAASSEHANIPDVFLTPYQDSPLDMTAGSIFAERRKGLIVKLLKELASCDEWQLSIWLARTYCRAFGYQIRCVNWKRYPLSLLQLLSVGLGGSTLAHACACYLSDAAHFSAGLPDLLLWRASISATATTALSRAECTENSTIQHERLTLPRGGAPGALSLNVPLLPGAAAAEVSVPWPADIPLFCPPCIWELLPFSMEHVNIEVCLSEVKGPRDSLSDKQKAWMSALAAGGATVHLCRVKEPTKVRARKTKLPRAR